MGVLYLTPPRPWKHGSVDIGQVHTSKMLCSVQLFLVFFVFITQLRSSPLPNPAT